MTAARLLDAALFVLALALLAALAWWWARPEILFLTLLGALALRLLAAPVAVPPWPPRRVVAAAVAAYAVVFSFVTVTRHLAFRTHALDLGYYVQLTWNLAGGRGPRVSLPEMHAWGDHLSPIMYLLVPLFWIAPGPVALLVVQSVALAAGALAVFGIARLRLGDERAAAAFALLYLVNPSLHGVNVRDFHAAALAIPLLLAAIYSAEAGRPLSFAAAVLLTLACREDAALPVMGLGLWLAADKRRWALGLGTAAGAFAVLVADVRWVIPSYRGAPYPHLARYAELGRSFGEILTGLLLHPFRAASGVVTGGRIGYLLATLAPLAFLPLLSPAHLLGALPALAQNLLGSDPILYNHRSQYQSFVLPFLVAGGIAGYGRFARRWPERRRAVLVVAMLASLALAARTVNDLAVERWWPKSEHRAAYSILARIPPGAAVSAQEKYVAHLSLRPRVFVFPVGIGESAYVLLDTTAYPWRYLPGAHMERDQGRVTITLGSGEEHHFGVEAEEGPHLLLRR